MRFQGKSCIVTGGGSGIGEAVSLSLAREGGRVLIADRDLGRAQRVAEAIGSAATAMEVDVSSSQQVQAMINRAIERHGRLDVLVNNAGFGVVGSVVDTSEEDWDRQVAVNLNGVFYGCKYAIPRMIAQGGGAIVNTASRAAFRGPRDRAGYAASKGAVVSLTQAIAADHTRDKIRINCVAPGTVDTPWFDAILADVDDKDAWHLERTRQQPMGRYASAQEIANGVIFLASDDASYVTGTSLVIDGGRG